MSGFSSLTRPLRRNVNFFVSQALRLRGTPHNARHYYQLAAVGNIQLEQILLRWKMNANLRSEDAVKSCSCKSFHTTNSRWSEQVVKVPAFAESISEGDIKFTCKVGDSFAADQPVMEVETDKTTMPVNAPFAGTITAILVNDGDTVKAGQDLFKMKPGSAPAGAAKAPAAPPPAKAPAAAAPKTPAAAPSTPAPAAAARAGPAPSAPPPAAPRPAAKNDSSHPAITGSRTEQKVKMSRIRMKIAARLKEAQNTCAMLTTFNEIDMSYAMDFRKANLDAFLKKHGVKLGFMSIFSKATAAALHEQPIVNAVIKDQFIVYREYVDISVAVASPRGLVVPVIRNVESKKYADIELTLGTLADKAKRDAITVEDMDGGTFTISNGGIFGSLMGTPIINPPQSAILGMHGILQRPIAIKGEVHIRPMMYVALTYDHRIIDGREAVLFLRKIKSYVETPNELSSGL